MIENQTGYPGPLRWQEQLRPGVNSPLNDAPMSLVDQVGDVSHSVGYASDYVLWDGPLAAGIVGSWAASLVGAGAIDVVVGVPGAGGVLELLTTAVGGDNVNLQQVGKWFNPVTGSGLRAYQMYKVQLDDLAAIAQIGLAANTTDFVTGPSTDGLFFTHATAATEWEFQARLSSTSTVVSIPVPVAAAQDIILAMVLLEGGAIEVYAGLTQDSLALVGSIASTDVNIPLDQPMSLHMGVETVGTARSLRVDYALTGQER